MHLKPNREGSFHPASCSSALSGNRAGSSRKLATASRMPAAFFIGIRIPERLIERRRANIPRKTRNRVATSLLCLGSVFFCKESVSWRRRWKCKQVTEVTDRQEVEKDFIERKVKWFRIQVISNKKKISNLIVLLKYALELAFYSSL